MQRSGLDERPDTWLSILRSIWPSQRGPQSGLLRVEVVGRALIVFAFSGTAVDY